MIAGQRMDLHRSRYETFEDLSLYCYRVAGTVGLMSTTVMGVDAQLQSAPLESAGSAGSDRAGCGSGYCQSTDQHPARTWAKDARRGRIYLPLEDLKRFNYSESDLMNGVIDDRWRHLMQFQITRARQFYTDAEKGISLLSPDARWPVWSALALYQQILDVIEENDYNVFNKRAFVPSFRKLLTLPGTLLKSRVL